MPGSSNLIESFRQQSSDIRKIIKEYNKSITDNIFWKNRNGLLDTSEDISFDTQRWDKNPMQFCQKHYGSQYYYYIILTCNNLGSIYEFTKRRLNGMIKAPLQTEILRLLSYRSQDRSISDRQIIIKKLNIYDPDSYRGGSD